MERQGQGIFRAPPYIQNDPKYVKLAEETIIESQLKCKKDDELINSYKLQIKNRRDNENKVEILEKFKLTFSNMYGVNTYLEELNMAKEDLAISMSLEPTAEDINKMESSCEKKSTELEMILMDLKLLTTKYAKETKNACDNSLRNENEKLNKANNEDNHDEAILIQKKIKILEEEILIEEWKKCKKFSNLEVECPSKRFLNLESQKQGIMKSVD